MRIHGLVVPMRLLVESLHCLRPWVNAVLLTHALAPLREVLEDGAFVGEVQPFLSPFVIDHFDDLQDEGLAAARGLEEALL